MKKKMKNQYRRGFTLVEIMAVIVIIGLLAAIAAKNFLGQTDKARVITTKATLKTLHEAVNMFKMDTGRYPTEEEGLAALLEKPTDVEGWAPSGYLEGTKIPRDAWKHDFVYQLNPESGKPFVIISYGADGKEGGEGYDADLLSTDVE
jgi:general secretion pathway protein G